LGIERNSKQVFGADWVAIGELSNRVFGGADGPIEQVTD
jgi:hypothetical protein